MNRDEYLNYHIHRYLTYKKSEEGLSKCQIDYL